MFLHCRTEISFCQVTQLWPPCLTSLKISSNKSKDQRMKFDLQGVLIQSNISVLHLYAFLVYSIILISEGPVFEALCGVWLSVCVFFLGLIFSQSKDMCFKLAGNCKLQQQVCEWKVREPCRRLVACPGSNNLIRLTVQTAKILSAITLLLKWLLIDRSYF